MAKLRALSDRQVAGVSSLVPRWDIAQGTVGVIDLLRLCVSGTSEVVCPSCSSSGELTARGPVDVMEEHRRLAQHVSRWKDITHEPVAMTPLAVRKLLEGAWCSEAGEAIKGHSRSLGCRSRRFRTARTFRRFRPSQPMPWPARRR